MPGQGRFAPPELLAPAGDWECVRAAVENGADAIYFGLEQFNARMRARNFTESDLPELMAFLHRRGVRGYVTFNTLVFPEELAQAERFARAIIGAGVDAAIVQDVGICRMLRRLSPDFPIHASTQMTVTSVAGVRFARQLGCSVVVLARELPVREIAQIRDALQPSRVLTPDADRTGVESGGSGSGAVVGLEVFVHGALCVAYSGQCLTSESLGGRSANRGVCAQACRMPYELVADGQTVALGDRRYLLSPQDLAGLELLPALIRAGVTSLKIEGRLKSPEYVANITRVYRQAIDTVCAVPVKPAERLDAWEPRAADEARKVAAAARYDLEMAFSRGLFTGWMEGVNNQALVHGRFGTKRGVFLGTVTRVHDTEVQSRLQGPLKPGDGVVFDAGRPDLKEEGGRVYEIVPVRDPSARVPEVWLRFGRGDVDFRRIKPGDRIWKTSDPALERQLRQTYEGHRPRHTRPVLMEVSGQLNRPLVLEARDDRGNTVRVESTVPLATAARHPLTPARLQEQLGRLGGSPFHLDRLAVRLPGDLILPVSELNRVRREAVQRLESLRMQPPRWTLVDAPPQVLEAKARSRPATLNPTLVVLVRNLPQLDALLTAKPELDAIYCEFEDPKKYRDAVQRVRQARSNAAPDPSASAAPHPEIWVAPPRVFKAGEDWVLNQVRSSEADGYLVRNYDHLAWFEGCRRRGDHTLNVANALAAEYFIEHFRLEGLTASYDLNHEELQALLRSAPPDWFEITLHQHMPMFHMEHCLFCAFLSKGTDYTNCGRPCDRHEVRLRDRVGAEHTVKADAGCRNTVFNALAQTGAEHAADFLRLGARRFRLEFLNETPEAVRDTLDRYRQLLRGEITGAQLWRDLKLSNQLGVTRGPMG